MTELLIIWAKFFAASALLLLFYWLVLRHRASYKFMRLYLITVPVLGIMMSGMSFEIPFQIPNLFERSYQEIEHSVRPVAQQTETEIKFQQPIVVHQSSAKSNAVRTDTALAAAEAPILPTFDVSQILRVFVLFVSLLLLLTGLYYIVRLLVIKSHMQAVQTVEGYDLIRSDEVSTPFSFAKTIFLPQHMDVDREEMIIEHEKAHIVHGHYIEVWFMELATRLLWFNPMVWLCRSELRNIHEYQADHDVISRGANVLAYQTTLLKMVLNEGCPVVNGFNHSFIRRRFIEMKSTTAGTLSRLGKLSMIGWVALLFCAFTFRACKPSGSNLNWQIPEVSPQEFVLDISVDENILDSCYNIYLSDEYLHIDGETPDTCLQVVDKKCQLRIPLTKVIAGRVRCIFPGNELCSAWINLFFVPGETVHLTVHNGFFNLQHSNYSSYISKIERAAVAMRNFTDWKTPTTPTFEAIERFQTSFSPNNMDLRIHEVIQTKEATVVHLYSNDFSINVHVAKDQLGLLHKGNCYNPVDVKCYPYDEDGGNWSAETRVFGAYFVFPPIAELDTFGLFTSPDGKINAEPSSDGWYQGARTLMNVHRIDEDKDSDPNFTIRIIASNGIDDCGYLIRFYDDYERSRFRSEVADLPLDENRQCTFTTHLDKMVMAECVATFSDGSICTHCERFPFIPGHEIEMRVYNGYFHLTGTGFYKEWSDADEFCENASKYTTPEETREKELEYLKEHGHEMGCISYFSIGHNYNPEVLLPFLSDECKESMEGKRIVREAEATRHRREEEARYADQPLYLMLYDVDPDGSPVYYQIALDIASIEQFQKSDPSLLLLKTYKGDDPDRPWSHLPRSKNGVYVYQRKE